MFDQVGDGTSVDDPETCTFERSLNRGDNVGQGPV